MPHTSHHNGQNSTRSAPSLKPQTGFTLFEVLVAVAVLAISMAAIYRLHNQSIFLTEVNRFFSQAPLLAKDRLAALENEPSRKWSDDSGDFEDGPEGYRWQVKVEDAALEFKNSNYEFLHITVIINDDNNQSYSLETYRFAVR